MSENLRSVVVHRILIVILLLALFSPLVAFLLNAFSFRWWFPQFIPNEWSLTSWERVVFSKNSRVLEALMDSSIIAAWVTFLSLVVGIPAARAMGLYQFRGKRLVEFLIILPLVVPMITFAMGLNINFIRWGLAGTKFGVILVHLVPVMPYMVLILTGVFANYNEEYEERAQTLGAGRFSTFRYVTLPAILPGIIVGSLFAFLVSWSQYILTFLIGSGRVITMPVLLFSTAAGGNNANTAAMALVFIAPAVLVLVLTSRFLSGSSNAIGGFGKL